MAVGSPVVKFGGARSHLVAVVGRLARDGDVVHVALPEARIGDLHEARVLLQIGDGGAAGVAHGRAQAADELVDDGADRAHLGTPAPAPFRTDYSREGKA